VRRISRRTQLIAFGGLALVFVAIAKDTPQGQLYFKNHSSPCNVTRAWNVLVNCDFVAKPGTPTEKFRVYIDPRTNSVIDVEVRFDP